MLMVNRKGFKFQMPITDREIWGIGLVTYQWSLLEHTIDMWVNVALGKSFTRKYGQRAAFKERARLLKEAVEAKAVAPWRGQLISLINQTTGMQAERDKIVHWLWSEDDSQRIGIMEWRDKQKNTWRINYVKLRNIALKIDSINAEFFRIMIDLGKCPKNEGFLLSIAWNRVCGMQNTAQ